MEVNTLLVVLSSVSFYAYVGAYFVSPHMKNEFKRFNLEKLGLFTIVLEFLGATGLLLGLKFNLLLTLSSLGLGLLMLFGLIVRIKLKDSIWVSLPAGFFMLLNLYIFMVSMR